MIHKKTYTHTIKTHKNTKGHAHHPHPDNRQNYGKTDNTER